MASFQYNLSKQGPEYQTILDFTRDDAGGSHGNWNFKACQVPVKSPLPTYQLQFVCLFAWGLTALSAQIGYIVP